MISQMAFLGSPIQSKEPFTPSCSRDLSKTPVEGDRIRVHKYPIIKGLMMDGIYTAVRAKTFPLILESNSRAKSKPKTFSRSGLTRPNSRVTPMAFIARLSEKSG